jgi:hypothetical protein
MYNSRVLYYKNINLSAMPDTEPRNQTLAPQSVNCNSPNSIHSLIQSIYAMLQELALLPKHHINEIYPKQWTMSSITLTYLTTLFQLEVMQHQMRQADHE